MDFERIVPEPALPLFVTTFSRWAGPYQISKTGSAIQVGSIAWPVANTAFYVPMYLPWRYPIRRVFWINGSSTTTTNMDFGIYALDGTRIYSTGSTAEGTVSVPQYTSIDLTLPPGGYYFALACSSTTANRGGQGTVGSTVARNRLAGILQQASALALPATWTPAAVTNACIPMCGITWTPSGF